MDADTALMRAWELGMGDAGWTGAVMEEADKLLPALVDAGYVAVDDETATTYTWRFTQKGVARANEIEKESGQHEPPPSEDNRLGQCSGMTPERAATQVGVSTPADAARVETET